MREWAGVTEWAYRRTPRSEKMRMLIVFGILALLAAVSELLLILVIGPRHLEGDVSLGGLLRWFGLWWTECGLAVLTTVIARNWFERPPHKYPGVKTGIAATVLFTVMFLASP
jgi:hypothetical protein